MLKPSEQVPLLAAARMFELLATATCPVVTRARAQARSGGAKNFVIVMPDADLDRSIPIITESFYGCAGERCLAGSVLVPVGEAHARRATG